MKKLQIHCEGNNDALLLQFNNHETQQGCGGNERSYKCDAGDGVTKVAPGFCIKCTKRSEKDSQKFTTENMKKPVESEVDNNHFATSNEKNPLFECNVCCIRWTKSTFCS
jgi:hypothetical protein